ncbi:MAG: V-type ATP synthase subunit D [Candidatus Omnitrophota bacterium]
MAKIKLTKGELKKYRDNLQQYLRYLPTLQLKKQQLQLEIVREARKLMAQRQSEEKKHQQIKTWSRLLSAPGVEMDKWIRLKQTITSTRNIAGVELPVFERGEFDTPEYDLFVTPLWVDSAIEELKALILLREEIKIIEQEITALMQELRITTQRVNLFEKIKIPESKDAIRRIKIYIGDQMANAVGRSKIAKRKIEQAEEVLAYLR